MDKLADIPDEARENPEFEPLLEELRKKRERSESPEQPSKRPRADTKSLLPFGANDIENPIPAETDIKSYNIDRLQRGLQHINYASKRNISPRTREFLARYKTAYKDALIESTQGNIQVVKALDGLYSSCAYYFNPLPPFKQEYFDAYIELRQFELIANYGDYLGEELQRFRADLKSNSIIDSAGKNIWKEFCPPKTWVQIADALKDDKLSNMRQYMNEACFKMGLDPDHMSWLIEEWAVRNRKFHNRIRPDIEECRWLKVAQQLSRDLKELVNVAPSPEVASQYETVLVRVRDRYFEVVDPDNPDHWIPNAHAAAKTREKVEADKKRAAKGTMATGKA